MYFILIWAAGDMMKTSYYMVLKAPMQLILSAMFQLFVDLLILSQFFFYQAKKKVTEGEVEMEIIKSIFEHIIFPAS